MDSISLFNYTDGGGDETSHYAYGPVLRLTASAFDADLAAIVISGTGLHYLVQNDDAEIDEILSILSGPIPHSASPKAQIAASLSQLPNAGGGSISSAPIYAEHADSVGTIYVYMRQQDSAILGSSAELLSNAARCAAAIYSEQSAAQHIIDLNIVIHELRHRMGNIYAHVSALVSMMGRNADSVPDLVFAIRNKISVLSQTQTLLAKQNWKCVSIQDLLASALSPYISDLGERRFRLHGGEDLDISARGAFIFTLLINELGMNALKHGALKDEKGYVDISWTHGEVIEFIWQETCLSGAPDVDPGGDGFGMKILTKIVPMDVNGHAQFEILKHGLRYCLKADPARLLAGFDDGIRG